MRKWAMCVRYAVFRVIEVEADSYNEAVQDAMAIAESEAGDVVNIEYVHNTEIGLHDYEELPDDYEFADGYYDDPDEEEEEFEPGRPILDQMALNP